MVACEGQIALQLSAQGLDVLRNCLLRQHLAHLAPTTRITDHRRTTTNDDQGPVTSTLHCRHGHNGEEAANVQTRGRRVIADVKGEALAVKTLTQYVWMGNLLHKATGPQYIKDVFHKSRVSLLWD